MYVQVVYLEVQPELLDTFLAEATANAIESRKEPGIERFDLLQQADAPIASCFMKSIAPNRTSKRTAKCHTSNDGGRKACQRSARNGHG